MVALQTSAAFRKSIGNNGACPRSAAWSWPASLSSTTIPCHWKVTDEAFREVFHFKHLHSHNGVSVLDSRGAAMGLQPNGHSRMSTLYSKQNCAQLGMESWDDWKPVTAPADAIGTLPARVN